MSKKDKKLESRRLWDTRSLRDRIGSMKPDADRAKSLLPLNRNGKVVWPLARLPHQVPPQDEYWSIWILSGGRGAGKTRTGAEEVVAFAEATPGATIILAAPTSSYLREVMVVGESGILSLYGNGDGAPEYRPASRRLMWPNGTVAFLVSAEEPDRVRGLQAGLVWAEEVAHWNTATGVQMWDNLLFCVRVGAHPRIIVTTTPAKTPVLKRLHRQLKANPLRVRLTQAGTNSNSRLDPHFVKAVKSSYKGSKLYRSEIEGLWPWRL